MMVAQTLAASYYQWHGWLLEGGKEALGRLNEKKAEDVELKEARKRIANLERALGRRTYDLEIAR